MNTREDFFDGPVDVDETFVGGKRRNMHADKRMEMDGRGVEAKAIVAGIKDRHSNQVAAMKIDSIDTDTMQPFLAEHVEYDAKVYTDDARDYRSISFERESVRHSLGEYVKGQAHTNGIESFWSMQKRAYKGTFHTLSPKHLDRYVQEFANKHNMRESGTLEQMRTTVAGLVGRNLLYRDLIADNGLANHART